MASESMEFANGARELEKARGLRARAGGLRRLRVGFGVPGITYGLGAYGSPIGQVTGVQNPAQPAPTMSAPEPAPPVMQPDQFAGGGAEGSGDGGGGMSSGGGV